MQDIKLAVRSLSKTFGFSITAVLMLAFGIGGTTAIFSIVEGVLLRPLPFPDPSRVVPRQNSIGLYFHSFPARTRRATQPALNR